MTRFSVPAMLALLVASSVSLAEPSKPAATEPAPARKPVYAFSVVPVVAGVNVLTEGNDFHIQPRGNVGVIEQSGGFVLIDSGGSPAGADEVIAFLKTQAKKPVVAIVLTHWHGDHTLGVSRLLEAWPQARVISTPSTRDVLRSPKADTFMPGDDPKANAAYMENTKAGVDFLRKASTDEKLSAVDRAGFDIAAAEYEQFAREMSVAHRVVPTEVFEDELVLADTDAPVEIHFFGRANTAGDAIAWLPKQNVVFTGDVVVSPIPYGFNAYPGEWIGVLKKIVALEPAVLVPGHGNPMRDSGYARRLVEMLETVRSQVGRLAEDKSVTNDNVGKQLDLDAARKAWTGDDAWLQRWFRNYWLNPIGSSALREARGEPVVQGAS